MFKWENECSTLLVRENKTRRPHFIIGLMRYYIITQNNQKKKSSEISFLKLSWDVIIEVRVILVQEEFNLHLSITFTANICQLQKVSLSEEATLKMRHSHKRRIRCVFSHWEWLLAPAGSTQYSVKNTCNKLSFCKKYPVTSFPLSSSCHHPQKSLTLTKGTTYPQMSKHLNLMFICDVHKHSCDFR